MLFAVDAIDREELAKLLADKLKDPAPNPRRRRILTMLRAIAPGHEALR